MKLMKRIGKIIVSHKTIIENFTYMSVLQVFLLLSPLITYPYLTKVLGNDLYGIVITAQVLVSYFSIIVDFGSNSIAARYIALCYSDRDKLSRTLSSIMSARFYIWFFCFFIYIALITCIPSCREHFLLYLFTYGLTLGDLLLPQFFFQGIEKMKNITLTDIIVKLAFISFIFLFIKDESHYYYVPIFYTLGYALGGIIAILIIKFKYNIKLSLISVKDVRPYVVDCFPLLSKELICTIKDKLNYFLVGKYVGPGDVVTYDLCIKFVGILSRPVKILGSVLLPFFSKRSDKRKQNFILLSSVIISLLLVITMNVFLEEIVFFFIHKSIDLLPVRLMLIAPIMLSISQCIGFNYMLANGMNKYVLISIVIATAFYCGTLLIAMFMGKINGILTFVIISLISYLSETLYKLYIFFLAKNTTTCIKEL